MASASSVDMAKADSDSTSGICPVCLSQFNDPRVLDCLHSACHSCLDKMAVTGDGVIDCPLCRTTTRLPDGGVSVLTEDRIAKSADDSKIRCAHCAPTSELGAKPDFWCTNCGECVCSDHLLKHMRDGQHNVQSMDEKRGLNTREAALQLCSKHNEALKYFCVRCDECICGDCGFTGDHRGHEPIVNVKDLDSERKTLLRRHSDALAARVKRVQQCIAAVEHVSQRLTARSEDVRNEIRRAGERAMKAIDERVSELLQRVQDAEDSRTKLLDVQKDELRDHLQSLRNAQRFAERLSVRENVAADAMPMLVALQKRVSALGKLELSEKPRQHALMDFVASDRAVLDRAIGNVSTCQGSAPHCVVVKNRTICVGPGTTATFVVQMVDSADKVVTHGDDIVAVRLARDGSTSEGCEVGVEYQDDGRFVVAMAPNEEGEYSFEIVVNGDVMTEGVKVVCSSLLEFDPEERHDHIEVTARNSVATKTRGQGWTSLLGKRGMEQGQHTWRVRLGGNVDGMCIGVTTKPFRRCDNDYDQAYYWYNDHNRYELADYTRHGAFGSWTPGETVRFDLDCDAHTLVITKEGGATDTIKGLPNTALFPYFCLYYTDSSYTLC